MTESSAPERPKSSLTNDQRRRVEAIGRAKDALRGTGITGGVQPNAGDIVRLADYILHGTRVDR